MEPDQTSGDQPQPTQVADDHFEQERVRAALRLLTSDQRQVIVMRYIEEWSNKEVAQVLGKPVGAVKALQHRALGTLRKLLVQENQPYEKK